MKVFISWSGKQSRDIAKAFRDWLPLVLHSVEPFVSSKDIRAGTRWQAEVASELDETHFGLICVTKQNLGAEWLNFEAGALAKSVDSSRVVPIAVDLSPAEVPNPLGQFQAITLGKSDIAELLRSMNEACSSPISDEHQVKTFQKWWPDLEKELEEIKKRDYGAETEASPSRSDRDLLEEVLNSVRGIGRPAPPEQQRTASDRIIDDIADHLARYSVSGSISGGGSEYQINLWGQAVPGLIRDLGYLQDKHRISIELTEEGDHPDED
ncbi:MAG TPA: toll/interleukin-1 receptor domain-containing protein [Solirubrobacterales bacterium]